VGDASQCRARGPAAGCALSDAQREIEADEIFDPQEIPRAVSAFGLEFIGQSPEYEPHAHPKAELILMVRGLVTCDVAKGRWMVPAQCALWIPGGMSHSVQTVGEVELYCLFLDPKVVQALPSECCTIAVSPLLRELVIAASRLPTLYDPMGPAGSLVNTMLNELGTAPVEYLHLPMPNNARLQKIADAFAVDPSDRATIVEWARRAAMSERSLSRLILRETGMTFGRWRQQFQIMFALERLADGESVKTVTFDLGYESTSAFIAMFKKALGMSPGKYLAGRRKLQPLVTTTVVTTVAGQSPNGHLLARRVVSTAVNPRMQ
jgi:AraC-like DNA-binding protein